MSGNRRIDDTRVLGRRGFLGKIGAGLGGAAAVSCWTPRSRAQGQPAEPEVGEGRRLEHVGWQVGITYQATDPQGRDRDSLMRLLDEMAQHRMNLLSLMMISYGFFDPEHDGYCWPVRNPALKHYWDSGAANGREPGEYVREVIAAAADRKIEVQLFMNWGIWNPAKIRRGYPSALSQVSRSQAVAGKVSDDWLHCPDSPGAWQAGLDEAADLLGYYDHRNVTSYGLERISYEAGRCFCPYTQEKHRQETGGSLLEAGDAQREAWKARRIGELLKAYARRLRQIRPNLGFWLHTQCAAGWGHDPAMLKGYGVDCLVPHTAHFPETKEGFFGRLRRLAPNPCVLHFCVRDRAPSNYPIWIKTPEIIAQVIAWTLQYPGDNLAGLLFFNENATSPRNKNAVYEQIKRFVW